LHEEFLYFQGQTTNAYTFLLINGSLNEDKELNLTTNHSSPRANRFVNYTLKTRMDGVKIVSKFNDFGFMHIYVIGLAILFAYDFVQRLYY
jgi:hypothetical protein